MELGTRKAHVAEQCYPGFFEGFGRLHESRGPSHDAVDVHVCITDTELGNHGVKVPQNCQETP